MPETDAEPTIVWLGNRDAIEVLTDPASGEKVRMPIDGPRKNCTRMHLAPHLKLLEMAYDITHAERGMWQAHSDGAPAWVASTNPALAAVLAEHYGCEVREPDPDHVPSGDDDTGPAPAEQEA